MSSDCTECTECAICLGPLKNSDTLMTLTCGHVFHHKCFLSYAFKRYSHILINCPLCRTVNRDFPAPHETLKDNLFSLTRGPVRCCHRTQKGTICKNRCHPFNYGYCKTHGKDVLPENRYEIFYEYLRYILMSANNWRTKNYMIDITKKLLIKYPEIQKPMDVHAYFLGYFMYVRTSDTYQEDEPSSHYRNPREMYDYYKLEHPPEGWDDKFMKHRKIV